MRILFIPYLVGWSHLIPLVALSRMLGKLPVETAFLLPPDMVDIGRRLGVNVLPVKHVRHGQSEAEAYRLFKPSVVVDDCSLSTGFVSAFWGVPRVPIQRTGLFPGYVPRNPRHTHSIPLALTNLPDVTQYGLRQPRSLPELFEAPVSIVPGIPSVEVLPDGAEDGRSFHFAGPLIVDDYLLEDFGASTGPRVKDFDTLDRFFAQNEGSVVYFTLGLVAQSSNAVQEAIRQVLRRGYAVLTSIPVPDLAADYPGRLFYASYLPMHYVCSRAKLMVHQCGSATYHYALLHELPAITLGTRCYDREDVALRLEELGVSGHVPAPEECDDFVERFEAEFDKHFADGERVYRERKEHAARLHEEIRRTAESFDFHRVLLAAIP